MATEYSIGVEQMVEQMVEKIPPEIDNKILDIDKEKESKEKENVANAPAPLKRFIKPSIEEIKAYCNERNNKVNGQTFYDFYESSRYIIEEEALSYDCETNLSKTRNSISSP